jgi:type IV pilus assembly protein PilX
MKLPHFRNRFAPARMARQRGVVLFFALVCLVAIMLAAVALVRSVDTNTIIAGNLALQQSATRSADAGTQAAITWLNNLWVANASRNVLTDANHGFNQNDATNGYYASVDSNLSLTATSGTRIQWTNSDSSDVITDSSGNTTRYVIQRMCRTAGVAEKDAGCLFSGANIDTSSQAILLPQDVCNGPGCPAAGQSVQMRITSRTTGPRNSVSYVQTFVY